MVEAKKLAFEDRQRFAGDPSVVDFDPKRLLTKEWAAERRRAIDPQRARPAPVAAATHDTTSFVVADGDGNVCSFIQSIFAQLGLRRGDRRHRHHHEQPDARLLARPREPERAGAGQAHDAHAQHLPRVQDGRPYIIGNTPGADFQVQTNLQVITGIIDYGLDPQAAIDAARWGDTPGGLLVEEEMPAETQRELARRGHDVKPMPRVLAPMGRAQAIVIDPATGVMIGGSDARGEGARRSGGELPRDAASPHAASTSCYGAAARRSTMPRTDSEMRSMSEPQFHFSPRPNRANEIAWQTWSPEAFERAQRDDKPVLLGISAVWCHWCHVMDETSYSDSDVIGLINDRFVAIRVDNDQRPDINARYNMGGWPTTAFLTPAGEVMAGMTYIPPDQMRDVLNQVSTYYKDNKDSIEEKIAAAHAEPRARGDRRTTAARTRSRTRSCATCCTRRRTATTPCSAASATSRSSRTATPSICCCTPTCATATATRCTWRARRSSTMCNGGTYDQEWGGFYRYSTKRDWSIPHYEKMLEDNAQLLHGLLKLYRISRERRAPALHRLHDRVPRHVAERSGDGRVLRIAGRRRGAVPAAERRAEEVRAAVRRQDRLHELERDGDRGVPRSVVDARPARPARARAAGARLPVGAAAHRRRRHVPLPLARRAEDPGPARRPGVDGAGVASTRTRSRDGRRISNGRSSSRRS